MKRLFHREPPKWIRLKQPRIGGKFWTVTEKGMWVLEEGPGTLMMWLCTAAGSGGVTIYDGVPTEEGLFEGQEEGRKKEAQTGESDYNGRRIYIATPAIMQPWAMNAGFTYGLTLEVTGTNPSSPSEGARTVGTAVWQKFGREAEKKRT